MRTQRANWSRMLLALSATIFIAALVAPIQAASVGSERRKGNSRGNSESPSQSSKIRDSNRGSNAEKLVIVPQPTRPPYMPPHPGNRFTVDVRVDRRSYSIGSPVRISFSASDDCYVYIFNTDSRGVTSQIFPNYYERSNSIKARRNYTIPNRGYSLVVGGPAGRETIRIVAYRQRYRALSTWDIFKKSEPFPGRETSVDSMNSRIKKELGSKSSKSPGSKGGREGLELKELYIAPNIAPIPNQPGYTNYYAEDTVRFETYNVIGYSPYNPAPVPEPYYEPPSYYPDTSNPTIRISSTPSNASVYIDGVYVGQTPGTFSVATGTRRVVVSHPDYGSHNTTMQMYAGRNSTISVNLHQYRGRR